MHSWSEELAEASTLTPEHQVLTLWAACIVYLLKVVQWIMEKRKRKRSRTKTYKLKALDMW
jgi:cytochrome c-type biogenesis protein CcmH/NrfF